MNSEECIFCRIAKGEIPSQKILETKNFISIKDVNPKVSGHSLIIPKEHYETFLDIPVSLYKEFLKIIRKISEKLMQEEHAQGFNLIMNNSEIAGQKIPHAHMHILPRKKGDGFGTNV